MTKAQHTQGPWHKSTLENAPYLVYAADGYAVADCKVYHGKHDVDADMCLIAAAPDLLAALEEAVQLIPMAYSEKARAAIHKAKNG